MKKYIERINNRILPLRKEIIDHKLYSSISSLEDIGVFMQHHVFAVWDFMSLLKSLQRNLTCTDVPWFPVGMAETRFLINEIVTGEESDVDLLGNRKSHFEMYLDAMEQCGADITQIQKFIDELRSSRNIVQALNAANVPDAVMEFVKFTFQIIDSKKPWLQSAVFTYGREDLIPGMFLSLIKDMDKKFPESISVFKYYLERHIEVDGDHHSHLAMQMTEQLCGSDELRWKEAEEAVCESLRMRIELWNSAQKQIRINKTKKVTVV